MNAHSPYILDYKVDHPTPKDHPSHMHNEYEMLYFLQGAANYQIEDTIYQLAPGNLLLIRPRRFHCLLPLEPITYERFVMQFPVSCIPDRLQNTADVAATIHHYPVGSSIHQRFEQIYAAREEGMEPADLTLLMDGLLCELLLNMKYHPTTAAPPSVRLNDTLTRILQDIDRHPHELVDVQSLLKKYFVSRSWLEQSFREQLGMTPLRYISKKRVLYAQALIQNGLSPTLAAEYCHYNSYVTFYRNYKKILRRTPEEDAAAAKK